METKTCLYSGCGAPLPHSHGNTKYCPNKDCEELAKKERQDKNYPIGNDSKKAIQKNREICSALLREKESGEFDLMTVLKMGFNSDGFYGTIVWGESKKKLFRIHDFYFYLDTTSTSKKIQIWKASKK